MTGPEWMIVYAATQVGMMALARVFSRTARGEPESRFWRISGLITLLLAAPVVGALLGWWDGAGEAIAGLVALALWRNSRRKGRKRAPSLLGAKSRALRDALVRRARDLAQPRRVLVPGSAR